MRFERSDAWVLLSLIYSGGSADRERIRSTGDFINHAILTEEELDGGLDRLRRAKYAIREGDLYTASDAVLAWHGSTRLHGNQKGAQAYLAEVEEFLGVGR